MYGMAHCNQRVHLGVRSGPGLDDSQQFKECACYGGFEAVLLNVSAARVLNTVSLFGVLYCLDLGGQRTPFNYGKDDRTHDAAMESDVTISL